MQQSMMRTSEVCNTLGIHRATLWRMVKQDKFPQPMKVGKRLTRWRTEVVEEWISTGGGMRRRRFPD